MTALDEPPIREVAFDADTRPRRAFKSSPTHGDRALGAVTRTSGLIAFAIVIGIGAFLAARAAQALAVAKLSFFTTQAWEPDVHRFGILGVLVDTILIAVVALVVSSPIALGFALFITEVAPGWLKRALVALVDLMAAVPSVVYGLWGLLYLEGHVVGVARFLSTWFGWIPPLHVAGANVGGASTATVYTASTFIVGLVVSMMVIPIQCSVMRESFSNAPLGEREGAFALGSTRWGMIRMVVLPFGRGGIIGGTMLGLGRALGETIAVYLIVSPIFTINLHILHSGGNSISALIALRNGEASGFGLSALMAAGLTLFALTMTVNFVASAIVSRSRSGAQSDD